MADYFFDDEDALLFKITPTSLKVLLHQRLLTTTSWLSILLMLLANNSCMRSLTRCVNVYLMLNL